MTSRVTVIVGAGASGGVLAARLSEDPNERIVLVEAGPDYVSAEGLPEALRDPFTPQLVGHDWGLSGHVVEPAGRRPVLPYPQGKAVGGSTVVNGAIGHRGIPEDYDAWRAAGNPSWGWE